LSLEVSEEILSLLKENPQEFAHDLKICAAVDMYRLGRLSSGKAAELAGISRIQFFHELSKHKVPLYDVSEEELDKDLDNADHYSIV
jgi:predicted HTH domain antitoxin